MARRTVRDAKTMLALPGPRPTRTEDREVEELFLNESSGPEYAEIKVGLLGLKTVLIPLQSVTADAERRFLVLE
jgi:hypothetical protein